MRVSALFFGHFPDIMPLHILIMLFVKFFYITFASPFRAKKHTRDGEYQKIIQQITNF